MACEELVEFGYPSAALALLSRLSLADVCAIFGNGLSSRRPLARIQDLLEERSELPCSRTDWSALSTELKTLA